MRFALAIVALVVAVALGGYGFAQRTFLNGPDHLTATGETTSDATVTVIGGDTLNSLPGRPDIRISGTGPIFAAYARTEDVLAWVGAASYNRISYDPASRALATDTQPGAERVVPAPAGSDLWLAEFSGDRVLDLTLSLDKELSILVVTDGTAPAPSAVSVTWPLDNRTPWSGPLIAAGLGMLVVSLAFLLWALVHRRRTRGPRRKSIKPAGSPRMPKLPRQRSYRVRKPRAIESSRGRRSIRRMTAIVPALLMATLVLSGCSANLVPGLGASSAVPSPSPSSSGAAAAPRELKPPAATVTQIESIVKDVSAVATAADASLSVDALKARFDGPALALRAGNYAIRAKDSAFPPPPAVPSGPVQVSLPQQSNSWPRSVFAVVKNSGDATTAPLAVMLVQKSPRAQYKAEYLVTLEPNAVIPELAPEGVGAPRLSPDTKLLSTPPGQLLGSYVDVLNVGSASTAYPLFDIARDGFIKAVGVDARAARKAAIPVTASIEFAIAPGTAETIALASNEAGALVAVSLSESETVKPVEAGATINPEGATKTLSGLSGTTKGVTATYGDQLLFYIPPVGSTAKIVLLGFSQGLISAQEIA